MREAATRAGRTPETVRRWIHDGKLPANVGDHLQGRYYDIAPGALAALRREVRELRALVGLLGGEDAAEEPDQGNRPSC